MIADPSAIIVTRGDVDLGPILASLPRKWERIVWDNGAGKVYSVEENDEPGWIHPAEESAVFGRYRAIEHATKPLIYVQDDDVILSDPRALVRLWGQTATTMQHDRFVVCNMPPEFLHDFYAEHALVGFGAVFQRDLPGYAFDRFWRYASHVDPRRQRVAIAAEHDTFRRCADVVFTALTNRVLADVAKEDMPYATGQGRMYRRKEHQAERDATLALSLEVREQG